MSIALIPLQVGRFAVVDKDDEVRLRQFKWFAMKSRNVWYAYHSRLRNGQRTVTAMHWFILGGKRLDYQVDHVNGNGLDNRKVNLRLASPLQNAQHAQCRRDNQIRYKGVSLDKRYGTYRVRIRVNKKRLCFGSYKTAEEAARVYNRVAKQFHGQFAVLNMEGRDA